MEDGDWVEREWFLSAGRVLVVYCGSWSWEAEPTYVAPVGTNDLRKHIACGAEDGGLDCCSNDTGRHCLRVRVRDPIQLGVVKTAKRLI